MTVPNSWQSPNNTRGRQWARSHRTRKEIATVVGQLALALPEPQRQHLLRDEPELRTLELTLITQSRVRPDLDNLVAGWKPLIDCLRRRQQVRVGRSLLWQDNGPGLIWDDSPDWLALVVHPTERTPRSCSQAKNLTIVHVYRGFALPAPTAFETPSSP